MKQLAFATIAELKKLLQEKKVSREELLTFFLDRFYTYDPTIQSALELFDKNSILKESMIKGVLSGIPGILKDNICQKERRITCGSKILEGFVSPYDASVCTSLKKDGALLVGRSNQDEFAMGSSTETSAYQKTKNPWNIEYVPGGSSGGSAAAVAAGFVPWALGTDTGGSVRHPAAWCGVVGLKPTYGLISRYGLIAYASSLDQIGVITRSVYDNALILSVIAGHDVKDSTSLSVSKKDYTHALETPMKDKIVIGIIENEFSAVAMSPEVKASLDQAIKVFESLGFVIKHLSLPSLEYCAAAYFIISRAEAASNLARFDGVRYGQRDKVAKTLAEMYCDTRHDGFGREVRSRILIGNYVLSAGHAGEFYENAKKVQRLIRREYQDAFKEVNLLLTPTQAITAFNFGAYDDNMLQMELGGYYTVPINLAGIPAISVPCGFDRKGLPVGMQLIGPHLSEGLLFQVAHCYEQATEWHTCHPQKF